MAHTLKTQIQSSHTSNSLWKSLKLEAQILIICVPKTGEEEEDNLVLLPCTCWHTNTFAIYIHKRNKIVAYTAVFWLDDLLFEIFIFYSRVCICLGLCTSAHRKPRKLNEDIIFSETGMIGHVICLAWVAGRNSMLSPESSHQSPSLPLFPTHGLMEPVSLSSFSPHSKMNLLWIWTPRGKSPNFETTSLGKINELLNQMAEKSKY